MGPRDLDPAKLFQMGREPLRIEQGELVPAQLFHQRYERDFGRIGYAMKHRFSKERGADRDAVEAASELVFLPSLN
jgi:hypothetical protein